MPSNSPACFVRVCATTCCRRSARSTTASNCSPTSRTRRCASAASSCSRKAPGRRANKLKFFRLAFGAGGGFGDEIDTREAKAALEGLYGADKRIELGWMVADDKLSKGAVKLLLNLAMIAGDALVRGGRLDVGAERRDGALEMVIRAEGPRILLDPKLRETIAQGPFGRRGRAARGRRLAGPHPGGRSRRLDPAQRSGGRGAADRRDPAQSQCGSRDNAALTPWRHRGPKQL